jgi:outer membrane protein assembly factor BamD (BamD/ComL family)
MARGLVLGIVTATGCASLQRDAETLDFPDSDREESQGLLGATPARAWEQARAAVGLGPDENQATELFHMAQRQYQEAGQLPGAERRQAYLKAAALFAKAARHWPNSALEEDSLFYQGESYFFADRYPRCEEVLGNLIQRYPNSRHIDRADARRFALAKYWIDHHRQDPLPALAPNLTSRDRPVFDRFNHGIRVLERIRLDDPTGNMADDATMAAGAACFAQGNYHRADELLTDLRRSYPSSEHQFEAHLLGLQCKMQLYQGPSYDGGPLDEAEQLIRQLRRQFPEQAREHDEFLARTWKDVRMNRAVREMELARYFDRRQEYRAARQYYDRVARDYADTSLAGEARGRLAKLEERPDKPPQRLAWLADMFPTPEGEEPLMASKPLDALTR